MDSLQTRCTFGVTPGAVGLPPALLSPCQRRGHSLPRSVALTCARTLVERTASPGALIPSARIERAVTTLLERVSGPATIRRRHSLTSGSESPRLRDREAGNHVAVVDRVGALREPVAVPQWALGRREGMQRSDVGFAPFRRASRSVHASAVRPACRSGGPRFLGQRTRDGAGAGARLVEGVSLRRCLVDSPPQDL